MNTERPRPLTPDEAAQEKMKTLPDVVIEAFNQLIAQNTVDGSAVIKQDDVIALLVEKGLNREEIFAKGWMDVEEVYRAAGWKVSYDKPGHSETYPATFKFERL